MNDTIKIGISILVLSLVAFPIGRYFDKEKEKRGLQPHQAYDQTSPINNPADWLSTMAGPGIFGGIIVIVIGIFKG